MGEALGPSLSPSVVKLGLDERGDRTAEADFAAVDGDLAQGLGAQEDVGAGGDLGKLQAVVFGALAAAALVRGLRGLAFDFGQGADDGGVDAGTTIREAPQQGQISRCAAATAQRR